MFIATDCVDQRSKLMLQFNFELSQIDDGDSPNDNTEEYANMTSTINTSIMVEKPVWFVTGCSSGFGHELAKYLLTLGYPLVITARDASDLKDFAIEANALGEALILKLDVTDQNQIDAAVKAAMDRFGRIDVLVNNAGIGYFAAVEESEEDQIRRMFEINFFGLSKMIHTVLPGMRKQRKGAIINLSSIGGLCGFPALGYYNATKFAVEGLSEALWQEVEPLGIKVMLVEPSGFRTDWAGRSANESKQQIDDYANTAGVSRSNVRAISGKQSGDPKRAVKAMVDAIESPNPPHRLLLGKDAFKAAIKKLETLHKEFAAWEVISVDADFPKN